MDVKQNTAGDSVYRDFWQNNLQQIEDIHAGLKTYLEQLENKYDDFDLLYEQLMDRIDLLSSVYSSYNSIHGKEYIIRLRTVLNNYRSTRHEREVQFNLVHYLLDKATELRNESVQNFPALSHDETLSPGKIQSIPVSAEQPARYTYITFTRNGSSFITQCTAALVIRAEEAHIGNSDENDMCLSYKGRNIPITDFFSRQNSCMKNAKYYVLVQYHKHIKCFAADQTGKRIFAGNDFVKEKTRPLSETSRISNGFLRFGGCSHIVLSWKAPKSYARK